MTYKLFQRRGSDGAPSTQFAATIVGMPAVEEASPSTWTPSLSSMPDVDASANDSSVPDTAAGADGITGTDGMPAPAGDPAEVPTISHIGRYALKRQLGAGGLGAVFEAWDPLLSRAVAVKTLQFNVDLQSRLSLDGLFLNEARAAAGLNHKYIVTIHDAGLSPHGVYIAMERLYGRDLHQALAEGWRPSTQQAVLLVRRVADALAYAHARGVIHCDIKPGNIFLLRRDKPKVLDFGIARILNGTTLPALEGVVAGSPRYRAPEQLAGSDVDARTDLYSLGVVLYELLTGQRAIEGDTLTEINHAVTQSGPRPAHEVNPAVPRSLSAIVQKVMARDPAQRYTCASEFAVELRRWLLEQRSAEAPVAPAQPPARSRRRSSAAVPWLVAGSAVFAVVAVLLAGGFAPRPPPTAVETRAAPLPAPNATPALPVPNATPALPVPNATPAVPVPNATPALPVPVATPAVSVPAAAIPPAAPDPALQMPAETMAATEPPTPQAATPAPTSSTAPAATEATAKLRTAAAIAPRRANGTVVFAVTPWGQIDVDGAPVGTTPPLTELTLAEGTHIVTLRHPDYLPYQQHVHVVKGKPVTLRHRFGS